MSLRPLVDAVKKTSPADILVYAGMLSHDGGAKFIRLVRAEARAEVVFLILTTIGGYPDPAYRMMRCLQDKYKRVVLLVPSYCKSAGTLMATGAHEIVMADDAHLGPLDIQVGKYDEVGEQDSGLTAIAAMNTLRTELFETFEQNFIQLRVQNDFQITSKTCADITARLTVGSVGRIYSQFDPMRLGDVQRSMMIAHEYAERLSAVTHNLRGDAIDKLVSKYSSHSFVIDRKEVAQLFTSVRAPTDDEKALMMALSPLIFAGRAPGDVTVKYLEGTPKPATRTIEGAANEPPQSQSIGSNGQNQAPAKPGGVPPVEGGEPKPLGPDGQAEGSGERGKRERDDGAGGAGGEPGTAGL